MPRRVLETQKMTEPLLYALEDSNKWTRELRMNVHVFEFLNEPQMLYSLFWKAQTGVTKKTLETEFIPL